jgi:hypothetical protein
MPAFRERKDVIRAPLAQSVVQRNFYGWRFERAAPHDEFPEGGLRICGLLPGTSASGTLVNDTANVGLFGTSGLFCTLVNPTGATTTGALATAQLFSATGPLCTFAQYFRRYRFRSLHGEFASSIDAANSGNKTITISYERDPVVGLTTAYTATTAITAQSVRFPSWTPQVVIPFIDQKRHDAADELWYTTLAGDGYTTGITYDRQTSQGAIIAVTNSIGSEVVFGYMMYRFCIDLYGFTNQTQVGAALRSDSEKKSEGLRLSSAPSRDKGDSKSELCDFVELTPKSRRVSETPPPSVRVGSRKS